MSRVTIFARDTFRNDMSSKDVGAASPVTNAPQYSIPPFDSVAVTRIIFFETELVVDSIMGGPATVGDGVGLAVGNDVGFSVGKCVETVAGDIVGSDIGSIAGSSVGRPVGTVAG